MDFFMPACESWVEADPRNVAGWTQAVRSITFKAACLSWCMIWYMVLGVSGWAWAAPATTTPAPVSATPTAPAATPSPDARVAAAPAAASARVTQFSLERSGEQLTMTVRTQFDLPEAAKDALLKGVSLFFSAEVVTIRPRWYWRDETVVLERLYWRLNFLPLSRRWRLQQANEPWDRQGGLLSERLFDDLPSALQALQLMERWTLRDKSLIQTNREQKLTFTFELDQFLLPRPLMVGSLTNDVWKLRISRDLNLILSEAGQ